MPTPDWIDSPYVHLDFDNWYIDEEAPQELKERFYQWMNEYKKLDEKGVNM